MKLIVMKVTRSNHLFAPIVALFSIAIAHVCCYGLPMLSLLGVNGGIQLSQGINTLELLFKILALLILVLNGFKLYKIRHRNLEIILYWVSLVVTVYMVVVV